MASAPPAKRVVHLNTRTNEEVYSPLKDLYIELPSEIQVLMVSDNGNSSFADFALSTRLSMCSKLYRTLNANIRNLWTMKSVATNTFLRRLSVSWSPTSLQGLYLHGSTRIIEGLEAIATYCPNLNNLELIFYKPADDWIILRHLGPLHNFLPASLRRLCLDMPSMETQYQNNALDCFFKRIPIACPSLETLFFSGELTDGVVEETLPLLKKLTIVCLKNCGLDEHSRESIGSYNGEEFLGFYIDWFAENVPAANLLDCEIGMWTADNLCKFIVNATVTKTDFGKFSKKLEELKLFPRFDHILWASAFVYTDEQLNWFLASPNVTTADFYHRFADCVEGGSSLFIAAATAKAIDHVMTTKDLSPVDAWVEFVKPRLCLLEQDPRAVVSLYTNRKRWFPDVGVTDGPLPFIFFSHAPAVRYIMENEGILCKDSLMSGDIVLACTPLYTQTHPDSRIVQHYWTPLRLKAAIRADPMAMVTYLTTPCRDNENDIRTVALPLLADYDSVEIVHLSLLLDIHCGDADELDEILDSEMTPKAQLRIIIAQLSYGDSFFPRADHVPNIHIDSPGYQPNWLFYLLRGHRIPDLTLEDKEDTLNAALEFMSSFKSSDISVMLTEENTEGATPLYYWIVVMVRARLQKFSNIESLMATFIKSVCGLGWKGMSIGRTLTSNPITSTAKNLIAHLVKNPKLLEL